METPWQHSARVIQRVDIGTLAVGGEEPDVVAVVVAATTALVGVEVPALVDMLDTLAVAGGATRAAALAFVDRSEPRAA